MTIPIALLARQGCFFSFFPYTQLSRILSSARQIGFVDGLSCTLRVRARVQLRVLVKTWIVHDELALRRIG